MNSLLAAAGLGFGLGVVTGMPLGVINVAIVDAATSGRRRFARGLGVGGGAADAIHALLAFAGVGHVVTADPAILRVLSIGAAAIIVGYAGLAWRGRTRPVAPRLANEGHAARGVAAGLVLTLPNPGALTAWISAAAATWPAASLLEAAAIAVGVGMGSALWFTLLARWIARVPRDHAALTWIPRVALVLLVAIALAGAIRASVAL